MGTRGGQKGNQNAAKSRVFEQALLREIKQRDLKDGQGETLRKIAAQWVDKALTGEIFVGREIRDTLDGKPAQAIVGAADDGAHIFRLEAPWLEKAAKKRGWA